jgi:ATP-dependent DNA helicase PIF1
MTDQLSAGSNLIITDEYREVFRLLQQPERPNIFITGNAGTGKSTLLRHLVDDVCSKRSLAVVAPTGVAALNVEGTTIHSFFRLPVKPMLFPEDDVQLRQDRRSLLKALDLLIVDEISMVRADMLDCVDYALRLHRVLRRPVSIAARGHE